MGHSGISVRRLRERVEQIIAKHETEPDASERDELARVIANAHFKTDAQPMLMADAILAAGWRKR